MNSFVFCLLGAFLYFTFALFGMEIFSLEPSNITLLWLPSGIGFIMCLSFFWRAVPFILGASFLANFSGMAIEPQSAQVFHTAIAAGADSLAPWLGAVMMRRFLPNGLETIADLARFTLFVCIGPTFVSAVLLAGNLVSGGYIAFSAAKDMVSVLLIADTLGILIVYPLYSAWKGHFSEKFTEWSFALVVSLLLIAILYVSFHLAPMFIFFVLPVHLFVIFFVSARLVSLMLAVTIITTVAFAASGLGPFAVHVPEAGRQMLAAFLLSTTFITLGVFLQNRELSDERTLVRDWRDKAGRDPLTKLANRRAFIPVLQNELELVRRHGETYQFAIALLDLDHFKQVNDRYGHLAGDEALKTVAGLLHKSMRNIDMVARIGGEEFAVLFPANSSEQALSAMERFQEKLSEVVVETAAGNFRLTASGGITSSEQGTDSVEAMLARADHCLYAAKEMGRDRIIVDGQERNRKADCFDL